MIQFNDKKMSFILLKVNVRIMVKTKYKTIA